MEILAAWAPFSRYGRQRFQRNCGKVALLLTLVSCNATLTAADTPAPATPAPVTPAASPAIAREYQLKAVFLFNFTKYVIWPATAFSGDQAPFVIGVLGDDPFGDALDDTVRGEKVNGRALVVHRYTAKEDVKDCQILFVSQSMASQMDQIAAGLKGRNVLTVGDADNFTDHGGVIGLVTVNNKIRLKINLDSAKASNLTINSNLLRSADVTGHATN
jgi:hypothetical protein